MNLQTVIKENNVSTRTNSWRSTWSLSNKQDWDYLAFGSGYRSNYFQNQNIDLGGAGTYELTTICNPTGACNLFRLSSKSRSSNYVADYSISQGYYCSSYSWKFWQSFRDNNSQNFWWLPVITPNYLYSNMSPL